MAIVGVGKIARDQHIPAVRANPAFELVACADPMARLDGVETFTSLEEMLVRRPDIDALSICSPPQARYPAARLALEAGKHVLLEKPPCETTAQLEHLARLAVDARLSLFQTWHSRHAAAVEAATKWLQTREIRRVEVTWKENVRQWHPGQSWIWLAGGFGVFDPGINAISILTRIIPQPILVTAANLRIPSDCEAPIAAEVTLETVGGAPINAAFDFRHAGAPIWDIEVEAEGAVLKLSRGGWLLAIDGEPVALGPTDGEYPSLYRRFAELIQTRASDVDMRPFQLVADAFLIARRTSVEPVGD